MDKQQIEEFTARSHALTMALLQETERQFGETQRLARRPWWVPFAITIPMTVALIGFCVVLERLFR